MFKKVLVGTLATGIMLSGAGGVFAETPTTSITVESKDSIKNFITKLVKRDFPGYKSRWDLPAKMTVDGVTWYLKGATEERDKTWTGHYEGWKTTGN